MARRFRAAAKTGGITHTNGVAPGSGIHPKRLAIRSPTMYCNQVSGGDLRLHQGGPKRKGQAQGTLLDYQGSPSASLRTPLRGLASVSREVTVTS